MNDLGELASPAIHDGVMYVINGKWTFALDVATGTQIWRTPALLEPGPAGCRSTGVHRRSTTASSFVTFDNHILALDMKTGAQVWKQKFAEPKEGY